MRRSSFVLAGTLAMAGAAGCFGAHAADMAPIFSPPPTFTEPEPMLEFGTGWYLRGDATFALEDHPKLTPDFGVLDANATAFGWGAGIGGGYKFNNMFRADVTGDYLSPFKYSQSTPYGNLGSLTLQGTLHRWDALANGYFDLGTWAGITPYIGAGAGFSAIRTESSLAVNGGALPVTFVNPITGALFDGSLGGHTRYQFAWAAMAGFAYDIAPHMQLDIGYRFLDLGNYTLVLFPGASVTKNLTSQELRVGIRYMID